MVSLCGNTHPWPHRGAGTLPPRDRPSAPARLAAVAKHRGGQHVLLTFVSLELCNELSRLHSELQGKTFH